jgi:hypothetical protein
VRGPRPSACGQCGQGHRLVRVEQPRPGPTAGVRALYPVCLGQLRLHGAGDAHDIGQAAFLKARAELEAVPVSGIGQGEWNAYAPGAQFVERVQGQAPLLGVPHRSRDLAAGPTRGDRLRVRALIRSRIPLFLGQEQPPVRRVGRMVGDQVRGDRDLAVTGLAQRAGVLPGRSRRFGAALGKPGVAEHHRLRSDHLCHPPGRRRTHRDRIPRRVGQKLLQRLPVGLRQAQTDRLDRLALPVQHQAPQVHRAPIPLIPPTQRGGRTPKTDDVPPARRTARRVNASGQPAVGPVSSYRGAPGRAALGPILRGRPAGARVQRGGISS